MKKKMFTYKMLSSQCACYEIRSGIYSPLSQLNGTTLKNEVIHFITGKLKSQILKVVVQIIFLFMHQDYFWSHTCGEAENSQSQFLKSISHNPFFLRNVRRFKKEALIKKVFKKVVEEKIRVISVKM